MPNVKNTTTAKWLAIFFIHEITEKTEIYQNAYKAILEDISKFENNDTVRVLLIEQKYIALKDNTLEFKHKYKELKQKNLVDFEFDPNLEPKVVNGWETALEYFLRNISAENRMLLTWSHGTAFGINTENFPIVYSKFDNRYIKSSGLDFMFTDTDAPHEITNSFEIIENNLYKIFVDPVDELAVHNTPVLFHNSSTDLLEHFKKFNIKHINPEKDTTNSTQIQYFEKPPSGFNCKSIQMVWIWEIANVLEKCSAKCASSKPLIDILVMTNCYMNFSDNWYLLRNVVKHYVGAETSMDVNGYNYTELLKSLNSSRIPLDLLAGDIVTGYVKKNQASTALSQSVLKTTALFCTDLSYAEKALNIFNDICRIIHNLLIKERNTELYHTILEDFRYIRKFDLMTVSETYTSGRIEVVDLRGLLNCIPSRLKFTVGVEEHVITKLKDLTYEYERVHKAMIVNSFIGENILLNDSSEPKKYNISGGSVFFPRKKDSTFFALDNLKGICAYAHNTASTTVVNYIVWDDLLRLIYPELFLDPFKMQGA